MKHAKRAKAIPVSIYVKTGQNGIIAHQIMHIPVNIHVEEAVTIQVQIPVTIPARILALPPVPIHAGTPAQ
jgi:hypothetical protein